MLLRREMEEMRVSGSRKESWISILAVTLIIILLLWLLGPRTLDIVPVEGLTDFILIASLIHAGGAVNFLLTEDSGHRQMAFLQTLPVRTDTILFARFISVTFFCLKVFLWMAFIVFLNMRLNGGNFAAWSVCLIGAAVLLLWMSIEILRYYFCGYGKWSSTIFNVSFFFWIVVLISGIYFSSFLSNPVAWILGSVVLSFVLYLASWILSIRRIHQKGFPIEVADAGLLEIEKRAQDLMDEVNE